MASGHERAALRQVQTLFRVGAIGSLPDAQLLERFADRRDGGEAAFEALVARHGPMVLGVCRQVLRDPHAAEDAFQATFLILVRNARTIRNRDSLAPWLYGVARRVAVRARSDAARRRDREGRGVAQAEARPSGDDLRLSLHDEIARLPEKYRAPVVLCDLEGRTHAEAAAQLQWPIGTVSGRLSRARALLRQRIVRRGLSFPAAALIATLVPHRASAALVSATTRAAVQLASGRSSSVSASALALARGFASARIALGARVAASGLVAMALSSVGPGDAPDLGAPMAPRVTEVVPERPTDPPPAPPRHDPEPAPAIACSPDGRLIASGGQDRTVKLWDMVARREQSRMRGHEGPIVLLTFSPDGKTLASASTDQTVKLWDVDTGREKLTLTWLRDKAGALVLGPRPADSSPVAARQGELAPPLLAHRDA